MQEQTFFLFMKIKSQNYIIDYITVYITDQLGKLIPKADLVTFTPIIKKKELLAGFLLSDQHLEPHSHERKSKQLSSDCTNPPAAVKNSLIANTVESS